MPNRYQGVDPVLSSTAIAYSNDDYIAEAVFPTFSVKKQSAKHFIYDRGRFHKLDTRRGSGGNSKEVSHNLTVGQPYYCEDHALKSFVADEDVENAETPTTPYIDATENIVDLLQVDREKALADMLANTAILTQNVTLSGTSQFSDYTNSDPFGVIETGMQAVHAAIHRNPNTAIIGKEVWDKLKHHPTFLERVKYSQKGVISQDLLASLIGVDRVLIGGAGYNTANEGQTDSMSYIWGKNIVLAYIATSVRPKLMTLGLTYTWSAKPMTAKKLRSTDEDDREGAFVRVGSWYYDQQLVAAEAGYLIKNAVA